MHPESKFQETQKSDIEYWHYQYDAFGRRITKYNPHTKETVHTSWDGDVIAREVRLHPEGPHQEKQKSSIEYWHYQQNSFEPIAKQIERKEQHSDITEYKTYYTVTDHIGTPRELFTDNGDIAWRGYYGTWGQVQTDTTYTKQETDCNLRYAGQYFDKESGLHYNRFRYYDPQSSQYLSSDPIGLTGGLTPQAYVDNPNKYSDPLGLAKSDLCGDKVKAIKNATDYPVIKKGSKEWDQTVKEMSQLESGKINVRTETATDAKALLKEARGNMNRYPNYVKDKGVTYKKGYEMHNNQNPREIGAGNDLQHINWKDGKVKGHIYYDKPN